MGRRALEEAAHTLELIGVVERPVVGVLVVGAPDGRALGLLDERRQQVLVHPGPGQDPGGGGAVLPGVEVAGAGNALGRRGRVGVVEHDDGRLAAQLEVDPLEGGGRRGRHLHAGPHRTGDRHHGGRLVHDQGPARVAVTAHDVEDAGRQVLGHDFGHEQRGDRASCPRA